MNWFKGFFNNDVVSISWPAFLGRYWKTNQQTAKNRHNAGV